MEKSKKCNAACINLEFTPSQSESRQEKIKEFWKYIDSQVELKPFQVPKENCEEKLSVRESPTGKSPTTSSPGVAAAKSAPTKSASPGAKQKSKVAEEKKCKDEKYTPEGSIHADDVEEDAYRELSQPCDCPHESCRCENDEASDKTSSSK